MKTKTLINKIIELKKTNSYTNLINKLIKMGFIYAGGGVTRECYKNDKIVVKIQYGSHDNKKEFKTYNRFQNHKILKYFVVPMYGVYSNRGYSILIAAKAKKLRIKDNDKISPVTPRKAGFKILNSNFHEIAVLLNNCFTDLHGDNIMKFGKSIVLIDLDSESFYSVASKFRKYEKKFKSLVDIELQGKEWMKQMDEIFSS